MWNLKKKKKVNSQKQKVEGWLPGAGRVGEIEEYKLSEKNLSTIPLKLLLPSQITSSLLPCYRSSSTYDGVTFQKPIINRKYPTTKKHLIHITCEHHSLAQPTLNVLRTLTLAYIVQNHLTQNLFYNKMLNISCNLLNTVLNVKNRMVVCWLFTLMIARLTVN